MQLKIIKCVAFLIVKKYTSFVPASVVPLTPYRRIYKFQNYSSESWT
jgi:hypothetical protein